MTQSKTFRQKVNATYNNNRRAKRLNKSPTLSLAEEEDAIRNFLKSGKAKRYPQNASFMLANLGDEPSKVLIEEWEYINSYVDITND